MQYLHLRINGRPKRRCATKMVFVNGLDCSDALKIRYKVQRAVFGVGKEPHVDSMADTRPVVAEEGKDWIFLTSAMYLLNLFHMC